MVEAASQAPAVSGRQAVTEEGVVGGVSERKLVASRREKIGRWFKQLRCALTGHGGMRQVVAHVWEGKKCHKRMTLH